MLKRLINKNFRKPGGLIGLYIIRFLKKNQSEYDELEPLLNIKKGDKILEIGYGLGTGIYEYSQKYDCTFHGVDFSKLMYRKALSINHEFVKSGKVVLQCADFDNYTCGEISFDCIYFLNVIYFWNNLQSRFRKIFSFLKQNGKIIIFMADAACFKEYKQEEKESIFYLRSISEVISALEDTGFKNIQKTEHSREKNCYYIVGYKG